MNCQLFWTLLLSSTVNFVWTYDRECNKTLTGPIGILQFNEPTSANQSETEYCEYNVRVEEEYKIFVKITSMSVDSVTADCSDFYITLIDDSDPELSLQSSEKYCGNNTERTLWTGNKLSIRVFMKLGLNARYKIIYEQRPMMYGGVVELSPQKLQTTFTSPNFTLPNDPKFRYSRHLAWNYVHIFLAPAGYTLAMNFTRSHYSSRYCEDEYVRVRSGCTSASPLISTICTETSKQIGTEDNCLYVQHYSKRIEQTPFEVVVTAIEKPCGGTLREERGSIASSHYPSTLQDKICKWNIEAPPNKRIILEFSDLRLSNSANCEQSNYVKIHEKASNGSDAVLGTFCGSCKPQIVKTSGNNAFIEFYSGSDTVDYFRSFVLNYTMIDQSAKVNCGGVVRSEIGVIQSPNTTDEDPPYRHCEWEIIAPPDRIIQFSVLKIIWVDNSACVDDYLEITQVVDGKDGSLERHCGYTRRTQIVTPASTLKVVFHSIYKSGYSDFVIVYATADKS